MTAATKIKEVPTLYTIARESVESAEGNESRALRLMMNRVRGDKALFESILLTACKFQLAMIRNANNGAAWKNSRAEAHDASQRGHRVHTLARFGLMDTILPNGKRLGEALKHDCEDAAEFYFKRAATEGHKARWYALIAKKLGSQSVEQTLNDQKLEQLQKDAEDE